jgi:hypothetical protein
MDRIERASKAFHQGLQVPSVPSCGLPAVALEQARLGPGVKYSTGLVQSRVSTIAPWLALDYLLNNSAN